MKLFLIVIGSIGAIILFGLVYFMYKSKKGTLNLTTNSWHYKLLHWMWNVETNSLNNACPYYWALVVSILVIPFYFIAKLLIYIARMWPNNWTIKSSKIHVPIIKIPDSKKQWFSLIWKHSKTILIRIWYIVAFIIIVSTVIFASWKYIELWILNWSLAAIITSVVLGAIIVILFFIFILENEEFDPYFKTPFCNLFIAIYHFVMIIPNLLWLGIKWLFGIIGDMCPAIEWNKTN